MKCRHCGDGVSGRPVRQEDDFFCSLQCANLAHGELEEEEAAYFEENEIEGLYEDEEG